MQLPPNKEHDKQVMRVPKLLKVRLPPFLEREKDHGEQRRGHDPARDAGTGREVGRKKEPDLGADTRGRVDVGQLGKVDHVRQDMDDGENDDGPCCRLVEGDVLVEGDDVVQRGAAEQRDEVSADGEQDEDDVHVQYKGGRTSDGYGPPELVHNSHAAQKNDRSVRKVNPSRALAFSELSFNEKVTKPKPATRRCKKHHTPTNSCRAPSLIIQRFHLCRQLRAMIGPLGVAFEMARCKPWILRRSVLFRCRWTRRTAPLAMSGCCSRDDTLSWPRSEKSRPEERGVPRILNFTDINELYSSNMKEKRPAWSKKE
jgi:hypothetical protein